MDASSSSSSSPSPPPTTKATPVAPPPPRKPLLPLSPLTQPPPPQHPSSSLDSEGVNDGNADKDMEIDTPAQPLVPPSVLPPQPQVSPSDGEDLSGGDAGEDLELDVIGAAMDGNVKIFDVSNLNLLRKSVEGNNILHTAILYEQKDFIKEILKKNLPVTETLIRERNLGVKNTPLHVAAEVGNMDMVIVLYEYLKKMKSVEGVEEDAKPWRAQNSEGDTALHVALLYHNINVAMYLLDEDPGLARIANSSLEAPLHVAVTQHPDGTSTIHDLMMSKLLEKERSVASLRDSNGLTPLHRVASLNPPFIVLQITRMIIGSFRESTLVCDAFGKSILHLLAEKIFEQKDIEDLFSLKEIQILKNHQDNEGNTPLHSATKCDNSRMVRYLQFKCSANPFIKNNAGISALPMNQKPKASEARSMTLKECISALAGDIDFLLGKKSTVGTKEFLTSRGGPVGSNFLHLLMDTKAIHHYFSSIDDRKKFSDFIQDALNSFPLLVCQTDETKNTPVHMLAQNEDWSRTLEDPALRDSTLLPNLLTMCADAITIIKSLGTSIDNEADNRNLPWVMQNANGNTPLHKAIIAKNKVLTLALLTYSEQSARLINRNGETPLHLLAGTDSGMEEFTMEEIMKLVNANSEALGLLDVDGSTPLSRALKAKNLNVVVTLLCNTQEYCDTNDQTLWHHFLKNHHNLLDDLLQNEAFRKKLKEDIKDGNTPIHIGMKEKYFDIVEKILEREHQEVGMVEGERTESNQWFIDLLKKPDNDGLTPILRALRGNNLKLAIKLCCISPEATTIGDADDKTFWHHFLKQPSHKCIDATDPELLRNISWRKVLLQKDKEGNTSLHLAIKEKRFEFICKLLEASKSERNFLMGNQDWLTNLLRISNNSGETPEHLLADFPDLPHYLEKIILTDPRMIGIRSSSGIPKSQLKYYTNSFNVIASLQTTITFAAAFTVPGGFIDGVGTPTLIRSIAFQVFMISDVIAMCLSIMYLICLAWMGPLKKRESMIIYDFAVSLLLPSLIATLVAFMSGVYATIYSVRPWIAITTLVLCSLVMLFFHKFMLTKVLLLRKYSEVPFVKNIRSYLRRADSSNIQGRTFVSDI